jgi:hypothetical protein
MPDFISINNENEINLSKDWKPSNKFVSEYKIVGEDGKPVSANYQGRQYQLVRKYERSVSIWERILTVVYSIGTANFSKSFQDLFTKDHESRRFGILYDDTKSAFQGGKIPLNMDENKQPNSAPIAVDAPKPDPSTANVDKKKAELPLNAIEKQNSTLKDEEKWIQKTIESKRNSFLDSDIYKFEQAVNAHKEEAELRLNDMEKKNGTLADEEKWLKKVLKNDCSFSDEDFTKLEQDVQDRIYFLANVFSSDALVKKLKYLRVQEPPLFPPIPYVEIFAHNMDRTTIRNCMQNYLTSLREKQLLLTQKEFNESDKKEYIHEKRDDSFSQIGRFAVKNFIEKIAKDNGLTHIRVCKRIAVLNESVSSISFYLTQYLTMLPKKDDQMKIYFEPLQSIERKISLDEAIECMIILEKTGYGGKLHEKFIFTADGIYLHDTPHRGFSPSEPKFKAIEAIKTYLEPQDVEKFMMEYNKRKANFEKEKPIQDALWNKYIDLESPNQGLAEASELKAFDFPIKSLL